MYTITLAAKHRWKGMVIILCVWVCVCVYMFAKLGNTTNIGGFNQLLADFKLYKDKKILRGFCLNPSVMKYHNFYNSWLLFLDLKRHWRHLETSKRNYSCIMDIASKALHQSKHNWGSGCYNIKLQEFSMKLLSSSQGLFTKQFWLLLLVECFTGCI